MATLLVWKNQDLCSEFANLATISGTNPLMKLAVAPNLDHGKKVRGENTHTSPRELKDLVVSCDKNRWGETGHTVWPGKAFLRTAR